MVSRLVLPWNNYEIIMHINLLQKYIYHDIASPLFSIHIKSIMLLLCFFKNDGMEGRNSFSFITLPVQ